VSVWWTDADQAELDAAVWTFVDGFHEHRDNCLPCSFGGQWCDDAAGAFGVLLEWRQGRALRSRAEREALQSVLFFRRILRRLETEDRDEAALREAA
jgi:hypothetical protein